MILRRVQSFIQKQNMLSSSAPVIVGVSGGPDSVVLLDVLYRLGYNCIVAHCNFHLRNQESDRDEKFVRNLAVKYKYKYEITQFNTTEYAAANKLSIEMAARELRYRWFENLRTSHCAQAIAVAHHSDDNIETMLINLVRGSGIRGMKAIRAINANVVRPLLSLSRLEIMQYASDMSLDFVLDSSNNETVYVRNKYRHQVIPLLEEIQPSARETLKRSLENLNEAYKIYQQAIDSIILMLCTEADEKIKIDIKLLLNQVAPSTVLYEIISRYGFNSTQSEQIIHSLSILSGKKYYSPAYQLVVDREYLLLSKISEKNRVLTQVINTVDDDCDFFQANYYEKDSEFIINTDINCAQLDADRLTYPLYIRGWNEGDWFIPLGMNKRKKISDFFIDKKISIDEKKKIKILVSGDDIVWILGMRIDHRFRITEATRRVVELKLKNM